MPPMTPSRVAGGSAQSSLSSGIFFQGEGQSHSLVNSHLSSSLVNTSNTGTVSGDMNKTAVNSVANSAPSVGASSLVTDANSAFSSGHHLQRSASINGDSYMRFPASPMSYTSNNISISESPAMDGYSVVQQSSHQDQNAQQLQQNQQQQGASSAMSLPASKTTPSQHQMGAQIAGSFIEDPNTVSHLLKKPRLDIKQDHIMQNQVIQQLLQKQDHLQFQGRDQQLQALLQQQQRLKQQQIFQSLPQAQRTHLLQQQQQQMQLRQQLQQQMMQQPSSAVKRTYDAVVGGVCARRLMQYLYHQRQRPSDNSIAYWKKFVAEYYSPRAKHRWCLPLYSNVGLQSHGVLPQTITRAWQCDLCGSKSVRRGFEATYEILPRLNEVNFGSGVIDELLFLDLPREMRFSSGVMMLEYTKAVQECVYEQLRVVREGQLRIWFTQDLKIFSWEFCVRRYEELLPRKLIAPQVNQLVQVAHKCQSTIAESGSGGVSVQDLQTNSNMVLTSGRQLAKCLELQSLNDLGFSKRYVRSLQIAEVCNSMKDLIDICFNSKIGAAECLKNFSRYSTTSKLQMQKNQEMEQLAKDQGLPPGQNSVNKLMSVNPGLNNHADNHNIADPSALTGSAQAALALTNYQNQLMRQNSMNSSPHILQGDGSLFNNSNQNPFRRQNLTNSSPRTLLRDGSPFNNSNQNFLMRQNSMNSSPCLLQRDGSTFNNSNQSPSSGVLQGAGSAQNPGSMQNSPGFSNPNLPTQLQPHLEQRSSSTSSFLQQNQSQGSQGNQSLQQQMVQQLLQMSNNNGRVRSHSLDGPNGTGNMAKNGLPLGSQTLPTSAGGSAHMAVNNGPVSRSNSFKAATSNSDSPAPGGSNGLTQNQPLQDVAPEFANDFTHTFFDSDLPDDDNLGFLWKE